MQGRKMRSQVWIVKVGGDDGKIQPWHHMYVYIIESRLIMKARRCASSSPCHQREGKPSFLIALICTTITRGLVLGF